MARELPSRHQPERRRKTRHELPLKGKLRSGEKLLAVEIGDISLAGALILVNDAPPPGATAELWIEDCGPIAIEIVRSGAFFCGVAFKDPARHRTPLLRWLSEDAEPMRPHGIAPLPAATGPA
jgi:PilZ domain